MDSIKQIDEVISNFINEYENDDYAIVEDLLNTCNIIYTYTCRELKNGRYPILIHKNNHLIILRSLENKNLFNIYNLIKESVTMKKPVVYIDHLRFNNMSLSKFSCLLNMNINFSSLYIETKYLESINQIFVNRVKIEDRILSQSDLNQIYNQTRIKELILNNNGLTSFPYNLKNITYLSIKNNPNVVNFSVYDSKNNTASLINKYSLITCNTSLRTLELVNTSISYNKLHIFKGLNTIKEYEQNHSLGLFYVEDFIRMDNLISLSMENQNIEGDAILHISRISSNLKHFRCKTRNQIRDDNDCLEYLKCNNTFIFCRALKYLEMYNCGNEMNNFLHSKFLNHLKLHFFKEEIGTIHNIDSITEFKQLTIVDLHGIILRQGFSFNPLENLKEIKINTRGGYTFTESTFGTMPSLIKASLSSGIVEEKTFDGLLNLTSLTLYGIHKIPKDAFYKLSNLLNLAISKTYLIELNEDLFKNLNRLEKLKIENSRRLKTLPSMKNLSSLEYLRLSKNNLNEINKDHFNSLTNLKELNLLQYKHLHDSSLIKNVVTLYISLDANTNKTFEFKGVEKVEKLYIELDNELNTQANIFSSFKCLCDLSIEGGVVSGNIIKDLSMIKTLQHLYLARVSIADINDFKGFTSLLSFHIINLSINTFNMVEPNLKKIILENNKHLLSYKYSLSDGFIPFEEHECCNK